jgi:hypothetical protein
LNSRPAAAEWVPPWRNESPRANAETPVCGTIDLGVLEGSGVRVLDGYRGKPNEHGLLERHELVLPPFERGAYFSGDHHPGVDWPDGANRVQPWIFERVEALCADDYPRRPSNHPRMREGMFLLLKLTGGDYLAFLPAAGPKTMTWLYASEGGRLVLNFGTLGTAVVRCDAPLFAWSKDADPYAACRRAWAEAITCGPLKGRTDFRMNKKYPEMFRYLGWCSWEQYKWDISEKVLLDVVDRIETGGLPIRFLLVDDGHLDTAGGRKLKSFDPDKAKFPDGFSPLLARRSENGIKWMGLWNTMAGYWDGVSPENELGCRINRHLAQMEKTGAVVPAGDIESTRIFYNAHLGAVERHGFDFVKIDCQSRNMAWYLGTCNAVEAAANNLQALEEAAEKHTGGMLNCMAHSLPCVFNTRYSAVTRCSIDYKVGKMSRAKSHLLQSYANTLWLAQTAWVDHDMFHSGDPGVGRIIAISKAMSAGPVYLSDDPKDFVAEYITPLCYEDGEIIRPLAPAAPLPDSILAAPMREKTPYRVIAPLAGGAAAVVSYNLHHPTPDEPMPAAVAESDYKHAGVMMQPYAGRWAVPEGGLVAYDWHKKTAVLLRDKYRFELAGFADRLVHLCPVRKGWALIGRTDKFLSPAAAEIVEARADKLTVRMVESGPLAIWCDGGRPVSETCPFEDRGGGLWEAKMQRGSRNVPVKIARMPE